MKPLRTLRFRLDAIHGALAITVGDGGVDQFEILKARVVRGESCEDVLLRLEQDPMQVMALDQRVNGIACNAVKSSNLNIENLRMSDAIVREDKIEIEIEFCSPIFQQAARGSSKPGFHPVPAAAAP